MHELQYDALNLSYREFYGGADFLRESQKKYDLNFISANIMEKESKKLFTEPYIIQTIHGGLGAPAIKVGIIGLAEERSRLLPTRYSNETQLEAVDPVPIAIATIPKLAQQCDLVVLLFTGRAATLQTILDNAKPIDVAVLAQEYYRADSINDDETIVVSSTSQGKYFTTLKLLLDNNKRIIEQQTSNEALTEQIPDDPKIAKLVQAYQEIESQVLAE